VTVLLRNVLRDPASIHARSDIQTAEPFLQLLAILAGERSAEESGQRNNFCSDLTRERGPPDELGKMYQFCTELTETAKQAVERAGSLRTVPGNVAEQG